MSAASARVGPVGAAAIGIAFACLVVIAALALQRRAIYPAHLVARESSPTGWRVVRLAGGGTAAHLPARPGRPTVVFLHGNATGLSGSVAATAGFARRGMGVLVPEYPGYAGEPGSPTEGSIRAAADHAHDALAASGVPPERIVVYGNSIGTGPAVHLARRPHAALILVSPVASLADVIREKIPFAPAFLVLDRWENERALRGLATRALVVHAADDEVVSVAHGRRMADAAGVAPVVPATGGHGIAFDLDVAEMVAGFAEEVTTRRSPVGR